MKTSTVRVNGVCNAACAFCELPGGARLDARALERAIAQLAEDCAGGVTELRISGGEPLLESRLAELVARARAMGIGRVTLETNAALASRGSLAKQLARAGVTDVLWALNSTRSAAGDGVYRVPGMHDASLEGARAFAGAGASVIARTPLAEPNLHGLEQIPAWLKRELPAVSGWWLRPIMRSAHAEGDPALLPTLDALEGAIRAASREARLHDLPLHIEDDLGLPLCLMRGDAHALASLGRHPNRDRSSTHVYTAACSACAARGECPGQPSVYAEVHSLWETHPYSRAPRALLARRSRPEQLVIYDRTFEAGTELAGPQVTIRVVMPCNQDCTFCFVDRTSAGLPDEAIVAAIADAANRGACRVSFSGGEPTLHRELASFIALAASRDIEEREIQTNALLLGGDDGALARRLADAGLTQAVVSLHAVEASRYLRIAGAGTPEAALRGVRRLLDSGVRVELNVVHNRDNLDHLVDIVDVVAGQVPEAKLLLSVTYIVDGLPRDWGEVAVRYTEAVPHLVRAMRRAAERGLDYRLSGRCGTPPCAWRDDLDALFSFSLLDVPAEEAERGHRYVDACAGCAARAHCYGINVAYLDQFGDSEFSAISSDAWERARRAALESRPGRTEVPPRP